MTNTEWGAFFMFAAMSAAGIVIGLIYWYKELRDD